MRAISILLALLICSEAFTQPVKATAVTTKSFDNQSTGSTAYYQSNLLNKYDINYLKLDLTVSPNTTFISGSCSYKMTATQPVDTFAIEFMDNMTLDSVFINNTSRSFTRSGDHIYIAFATPLAQGSSFTARFVYSGSVLQGLAYGVDTSGLVFAATLSESFQARHWFPAKQLLNDKIDSVDTWLTTTSPNMAGSNGLLKAVVTLPGGMVQYRWSTHYPMSYYMPCFAVANYMEYRNYAKPAAMNGDSILIQHYIVNSPSFFNAYKSVLDKTPVYIEKFSELFGLYPFANEKYGHLHARIGGGMEHQTMSTMSSFNTTLVGHELCHQWFGDNVTCGSWQDIWLNEGFATFGENLLREYYPQFYTTTAAQEMLNYHNDVMSQTGGSVYIPASSAYNEGRIFSGRLTYNKGAAVIRNLRFEMQSDSLFFTTLKTYQNTYRGSFAVTNDFKAVAEQVCGRSFTDFFNQWIYGEGYPTYNVTYGKLGSDTLLLHIDQTTSMPSVTPLFKGVMEYKIVSPQGDTVVLVNHTANSEDFKIPYTKTPTDVVVDPNNWVINKTGVVAVPLMLLSFKGEMKNNVAQLTWLTAEEKNVSHFEVQRSSDGVIYLVIGSVIATAAHDYHFIDSEPQHISYYRLKMIDDDGRFTYSNIIQLKADKTLLDLTYNQTASMLHLKATATTAEKLEIIVTDLTGKTVIRQQKVMSEGINEFNISLHSLPKGVYVAQAVVKDTRKALKVRR